MALLNAKTQVLLGGGGSLNLIKLFWKLGKFCEQELQKRKMRVPALDIMKDAHFDVNPETRRGALGEWVQQTPVVVSPLCDPGLVF